MKSFSLIRSLISCKIKEDKTKIKSVKKEKIKYGRPSLLIRWNYLSLRPDSSDKGVRYAIGG